jgi:hypothetical protein
MMIMTMFLRAAMCIVVAKTPSDFINMAEFLDYVDEQEKGETKSMSERFKAIDWN